MVERVRQGKGEKKILVIDIETEDEMQQRGEQINTDDAIVMIPRVPPPPPLEVCNLQARPSALITILYNVYLSF